MDKLGFDKEYNVNINESSRRYSMLCSVAVV